LYALLISPIPCTFLASHRRQSISTGSDYDSLQLYCSNFNWLSLPCPCISPLQYTQSELTPWCTSTHVLSRLQHVSGISWTVVLRAWRCVYVWTVLHIMCNCVKCSAVNAKDKAV
jgi:hypothetical protein